MTGPASTMFGDLLAFAMPGRELILLVEQHDEEGYAALGLVSPEPGSTDGPILVVADRAADIAAVTLSDDDTRQLRDALDAYLAGRPS